MVAGEPERRYRRRRSSTSTRRGASRRTWATRSSASSRGEGSRGHGWTPSSRNGCRASSLGSWRSSRSGTRPPGTARELAGERWAPLEPSLPRRITERMMKRVISVLRDARHGGTVIFVPLENTGDLSREHPYIDLRYPFADGPARRSFPDLVVDILNRLTRLYGTADQQEPVVVGWEEFEATTDAQIETLDEALFETAHLIASLAAADGAVVMSKQNELLGFGSM